MEGYNGRLDAMQAGFLRIKLRQLAIDGMNSARQAAEWYAKIVRRGRGNRDAAAISHSWARSVYHLYVVQVEEP